jgi:hypothetical protein
MDDVVGNRGRLNPLYHLSINSNANRVLPFRTTDGAYASEFSENLGVPIDPDGYWFGFKAIIPHPSPVVLQNWALQAHSAFADQVPPTVSLANFMYELKDLKGMIPKIESSIAKTVSSNFLAFNFGVAPFVGDVKNLMNLADTVNKRLKYLRETVGKVQKLRFKRTIPVESWNGDPIISYPLENNNFFSEFSFEFRRVNYQGVFNASCDLFQNLEGLDSQLGTLKAFAAAAGFNNPAAIVWEAIPYSFVVDWFFHFGQQLDYLAVQPFGGEWRLDNVMHSIKEEWQYEIWQVPPQHSELMPYNVKQFVGSATIRRFMRLPGLPVKSVVLTDGSLTPKQLALSLALLETNRR